MCRAILKKAEKKVQLFLFLNDITFRKKGSDFVSYRYCEAFSEVDYILSGLKTEERNKIPMNLLNVIRENKAPNYIVNVDLKKSLFEQNLKNETLAVLALIYRKYLGELKEREEMDRHYRETLREPELRENGREERLQNIKKIEKIENRQLCLVKEKGLWIKIKEMWISLINKKRR